MAISVQPQFSSSCMPIYGMDLLCTHRDGERGGTGILEYLYTQVLVKTVSRHFVRRYVVFNLILVFSSMNTNHKTHIMLSSRGCP